MAFFQAQVHSAALGMQTNVNIISPSDSWTIKSPRRTVYLLHGLSDNAYMWTRMTNIERQLRERDFTVIMPEVQRSFYIDMAHGPKYFTYITKELPEFIAKTLKISSDPEDTFVAGLSMGGYGAMKCALNYPQNYRAAAAFSAVVDFRDWVKHETETDAGWGGIKDELDAILGKERRVLPSQDLFALMEQHRNDEKKPDIYITCGTEDELITDDSRFAEALIQSDFTCETNFRIGTHSWEFWEQAFGEALDFFDRKSAEKR